MNSALAFCVVVPAHNEELGIERCVRTVCDALRRETCRTGLIVVDDGSKDATGAILGSLDREYPELDIVSCDDNGGYGAAVRRGIERAATEGFEYALFMDSDLTTDPGYIGGFVSHMRRGVDVIKASRYIPGGQAEGVPAYRVAISVVGNWLSRRMYRLPVRDCTNGFQAIRVDFLKRMPLEETGFAIIMEELYYAKCLAGTFAEVPYVLRSRSDLLKKSSFYYRPRTFYSYLKYPVKSLLGISPRKMVVPSEGKPPTSEAPRN